MAVTWKATDNILVVTISNPPVNALSKDEREGLIAAIREAESLPVAGVVLHGSDGTFVSGADVREFGRPSEPPFLPDVVAAIDACSKPVVAAIEGSALGGGLEIALACHFRIARRGASLGLPEVTLGLVPGAGGTQRLPRLIDPAEALRIVGSGKHVPASEALELGLVDDLTADDPLAAAILLAGATGQGAVPGRRLSDRSVTLDREGFDRLDRTARDVTKGARGARAPQAAMELVRTAVELPFQDGIKREREIFLDLRQSPESTALRYIFFAERAAAKPPLDAAETPARTIARVGIVGAGTMGTGIAINIADAGLPVTLLELAEEQLSRGLARVAESYALSAERGRIDHETARRRTALIDGTTRYSDLSNCDLIIEAAFESMPVKREIFSALDEVAAPGTILATNTSYLDIDEIAASTRRPGDVVGLHYFSPANVMRLLEIVRAAKTSAEVLATSLSFAKGTKKTPVIAGVGNGFIGNRMLRAYNREAGLLLLEGADPEQIDRALTAFGMAMGPFAVADLSGIDIGYKARQAMSPDSVEPQAFMIHDALVEAGHLGRKSGGGFYLYDDGAKERCANPLVADLLSVARNVAKTSCREIADEEIVERCILALASEGASIVDEHIAANTGDVDVVYVNGYGFPRHRGGPMFYVAQLDPDQVAARMAAYRLGPHGRWWQPSSIFG